MPTLTATVVVSDLAGHQATRTATTQITDPPPTGLPTLGTSMSRWPAGASPKENARCYNDGDVGAAIARGSRVYLYSPGQLSPTAAVQRCQSILAQARAAGISNPEVHITDRNEVDRHITSAAEAAGYIARLRDVAQAVNSVQGCSTWLNITRDGIRTGEVEIFRIGPADGIGLAVNCYSPGRKESPAVYTHYEKFIPMMFDLVEEWGITEYDCWEFGQEVGGRADTQGTTAGNRPDYIAGQVRFMVAEAARRGIRVRALCYWNSIKTAGGQPDLTQPDNRLMHDEPLTSDALRTALD